MQTDGGGVLLTDDTTSLRIGDVNRYKITVNKKEFDAAGFSNVDKLFLRVTNNESALIKPVYLVGPYSLYIDVRPYTYEETQLYTGDPRDIQFCSDLKPDEHFNATLNFNNGSRVRDTDSYSWTIDILSQIAVTAAPKVEYSLRVATTKNATKLSETILRAVSGVIVTKWDTRSLWNLPPQFPNRPVHLVIVTHGIFSNIGCDMLYVKDKIEEVSSKVSKEINSNVIVRGYVENVGKSTRGIRYLGKRVAEYILELVDKLNSSYNVDKISFVGHSLGGPTQAMAIHYICSTRPDFFNKIKPINFIALASPFLGVSGDFPKYASLALDMGALGVTGRDLTLKHTPTVSLESLLPHSRKDDGLVDKKVHGHRLTLEVLPQQPAKAVFEKFLHRTAYANVAHDGIVPLRTAALLYLDWHSLAKIRSMRQQHQWNQGSAQEETPDIESPSSSAVSLEQYLQPKPYNSHIRNKMGEIPQEQPDKKATLQWLMPQALVHNTNLKKYKRTQTLPGSSSEESVVEDEENLEPPPVASTTLAALSLLTAPLPSSQYIIDPRERKDSIVHDKVYNPDELPPPHYMERPLIKKIIYPNERINRVQERIARSWQETMSWRKVLVHLKPDSHNNIIVRRRFVNLYGSVVVAHMVEEHFGDSACRELVDCT